MAYKKFQADYLFTGMAMLEGDAVLIIDETGIVEAVVPEADAGGGVQRLSGILTPGFINCHCHLELSHLKGQVPPGTGLVDFLITVINQRGAVKEAVQSAAQQTAGQLYNGGTVALGDICNTADTLLLKKQLKLQLYNFVECLGFTTRANERFAFSQKLWQQFSGNWQTAIVPHAPYSVSRELFKLINDAASGKTITIHNQESAAEDALYKTGKSDFKKLYASLGIDTSFFEPSGKSAVQTYLPWLSNAPHLLLVHNTYTGAGDIDFILYTAAAIKQQVHFCLCPNANVYIEEKLPPAALLSSRKCSIVMGTDSYASNTTLDMLHEIRTAQQAFELPLGEILQWATLNGAAALQMDNTLGSFEKGKQPGIVLIDKTAGQQITAASSARRLA